MLRMVSQILSNSSVSMLTTNKSYCGSCTSLFSLATWLASVARLVFCKTDLVGLLMCLMMLLLNYCDFGVAVVL